MNRITSILTRGSIFFLITFTFQRCVSFEKNVRNPVFLTAENVNSLNGVYQITDSKNKSRINGKQTWIYNNFLTEIDRKLLKDTLLIDSHQVYHFQLHVNTPEKIDIQYIENGKVIRTRSFNAKLKQDGYLYLKNKNIGFWLVPYLAGALDLKRTRLTIDVNGDLIFDVANHRSGAFGLILFLDGRTWKYRNSYQKI